VGRGSRKKDSAEEIRCEGRKKSEAKNAVRPRSALNLGKREHQRSVERGQGVRNKIKYRAQKPTILTITTPPILIAGGEKKGRLENKVWGVRKRGGGVSLGCFCDPNRR